MLPTFLRLLERSGTPHEIRTFSYGACLYMQDGREELLAALVFSPPKLGATAEASLALFDRDGALRDFLVVGCSALSFDPHWSSEPPERRTLSLVSPSPWPPVFSLRRGTEVLRIQGSRVRLRAIHGRFEVVEAPK
jgi:hypothetical protein